ncbi:MAG: hypothetical protein N2234_08225, partial [Planctomycetota bacterium]|nr:hypothetical protein [Planctomycetota bacterium]
VADRFASGVYGRKARLQIALQYFESGDFNKFKEFVGMNALSRDVENIAAEVAVAVLKKYLESEFAAIEGAVSLEEKEKRLREVVVLEKKLPLKEQNLKRLASARIELAELLSKRGEVKEAARQLRLVIGETAQMSYEAMKAHFRLAMAMVESGEKRDALVMFEEWLRIYERSKIEAQFTEEVTVRGQIIRKARLDERAWALIKAFADMRREVQRQILCLYAESERYGDALSVTYTAEEERNLLLLESSPAALKLATYSDSLYLTLWRGVLLTLLDDREGAKMHFARSAEVALALRSLLSSEISEESGKKMYQSLLTQADAAELLHTLSTFKLENLDERKKVARLIRSRLMFGSDTETLAEALSQQELPPTFPATVSKNQNLYLVLLATMLEQSDNPQGARALLMQIKEDESLPMLRHLSKVKRH